LHGGAATLLQTTALPGNADFQEFVMRGSSVDQLRKGTGSHSPTEDVPEDFEEQIRTAEMAAGLQPLAPPESEFDAGGAVWFAIGAGISAAIIAVAAAVG
jgi:hypothetical protein